ncbi:nucleotidyltransferase family protein [Ectothiorhodospira mobilis]|nr:nucleotidyltransferase family protein [Ectothiorhodospira mobilis]
MPELVHRYEQNPMSSETRRDEVLAILQQFKDRRGERYGITRIGLFGSVARGDSGPDSDIDVVYETDAPNLFRASHMRQELEEWMGCHVDVIRLRARMNPRLKARIQNEARYVT